jgi:GT2 family glycosyltransferase
MHTPTARGLAALASETASLPRQPLVSVLMPVFNTDPRWLRAAIESVQRQVYPRWELCIADDASTSGATLQVLEEAKRDARVRVMHRAVNGHIAAASNDALALAAGEFVALLDHDDELAPDALAEVVRALNAAPDVDVVYSDEDKLSLRGVRCDPFFKPDWSPEHFLGQMYTCHLTVARTALVREVGGFREGFEGSQDYDLWLRMAARTSRIHHVPKILYHWRKIPGSAAAVVDAKSYALENARRALEDHARCTGMDAVVESGLAPSLWRVRRRIRGSPAVTIVVSGGSERTVRSFSERSTWPHRRLVPFEAGANYSAALNRTVRQVDTDYLVIVRGDVEIITPDWLEGLLEFAQVPDIGAVGCKLRLPDGRLYHVGIVTGVEGVAANLYREAPSGSFGWNGGAMTVRNYSAVSGALMMTRRDAWDRVAGFDEKLGTDYNDIDYCLRLREAGYRIVFTPFVEAYYDAKDRSPDSADAAALRRKWGSALGRDPYYNPNLTGDFPDCRLRMR